MNNNHNGGTVASFSTYNKDLLEIINQKDLSNLIINDDEQLSALLNGRASTILRQNVAQDIRKNSGIFFTNHMLSEFVAKKLSGSLAQGMRVADPACGAGNLLLACARYLPIGRSLVQTVETWSGLISGSDLFEEFITATKLRLILLAAIRSKDVAEIHEILLDSRTFPGLNTSNLLTDENDYGDLDCIVVNPPFGNTKATDDCGWATGNIQVAASFIDKLFRSASPSQHIVAILPDVLRSGTRYQKWRNVISNKSASLKIEPAGRFDAETDVDVFILHAIVREESEDAAPWPTNDSIVSVAYTNTVSDYFDVCVGTIVPHRDPKEGNIYPYIHARTARKGQVINNLSETICTSRKVFTSPFVVIHRTSSPNDNPRCVASIVNMNREVAVENHLIVLQPKNGEINLCKRSIKVLGSQNTNDFLNERIRCRHLTVPSVNEIPWIEDKS